MAQDLNQPFASLSKAVLMYAQFVLGLPHEIVASITPPPPICVSEMAKFHAFVLLSDIICQNGEVYSFPTL